jgi:hypothetical protein
MNRKMLVAGALMLALGGGAFVLACGLDADEMGKHVESGPMHVPGARVNVVNIDSGVVIHVTGGDAATVARIQAAAAGQGEVPAVKSGCKHCAGHGAARPTDAAKAGVYVCAMGDYSGPMTKNGSCPKCGMSLSLKK